MLSVKKRHGEHKLTAMPTFSHITPLLLNIAITTTTIIITTTAPFCSQQFAPCQLPIPSFK
ncbi:hypothetical protein E2C01_002805 [Portunus trituberculatus]|uniref:Uncharacterized protein n=1 Tax=Portunus trituberculatus TaxID=210409 RepID=A0A5B7CP63_PORTR|nr:hypothetical protein [Portunus trituberculatus]